jgi:hypothetical protein
MNVHELRSELRDIFPDGPYRALLDKTPDDCLWDIYMKKLAARPPGKALSLRRVFVQFAHDARAELIRMGYTPTKELPGEMPCPVCGNPNAKYELKLWPYHFSHECECGFSRDETDEEHIMSKGDCEVRVEMGGDGKETASLYWWFSTNACVSWRGRSPIFNPKTCVTLLSPIKSRTGRTSGSTVITVMPAGTTRRRRGWRLRPRCIPT